MGQKPKSGDAIAISELPLKADIKRTLWEVRKVPNPEVTDICCAKKAARGRVSIQSR